MGGEEIGRAKASEKALMGQDKTSFIREQGEGGKHASTHHQQTWFPVSPWAVTTLEKNLSHQFYCKLDVNVWGIPRSAWVSYPNYTSSQPLSLLTEVVRGILMLCKHSSAVTKTLVCYQHCSCHWSKTQHHLGYCEESLLHSSQTQYACKSKHIFKQASKPLVLVWLNFPEVIILQNAL